MVRNFPDRFKWTKIHIFPFLFLLEMQDFSQLSSRTVTEVLMLEMKMAPAAKAYLVSGFPRSMRDVVEYQEKVNNAQSANAHSVTYTR